MASLKNNMTDLKDNIESLREKLYLLILNQGLNTPQVVLYSQNLDKLLLEY